MEKPSIWKPSLTCSWASVASDWFLSQPPVWIYVTSIGSKFKAQLKGSPTGEKIIAFTNGVVVRVILSQRRKVSSRESRNLISGFSWLFVLLSAVFCSCKVETALYHTRIINNIYTSEISITVGSIWRSHKLVHWAKCVCLIYSNPLFVLFYHHQSGT